MSRLSECKSERSCLGLCQLSPIVLFRKPHTPSIVSRGLRRGHVTSGARDQVSVSLNCLLTTGKKHKLIRLLTNSGERKTIPLYLGLISDSQVARMSLDLYTRNIPLTQKARFWGNYVSALKGKHTSACHMASSRDNASLQEILTSAPHPRQG